MTEETLADEIETLAGESIEACVLGRPEWGDEESVFPVGAEYLNRVLSWSEARPLLNAPCWQCHPLTIWTASKVIFLTEDIEGAVMRHVVPRNPGAMQTAVHITSNLMVNVNEVWKDCPCTKPS